MRTFARLLLNLEIDSYVLSNADLDFILRTKRSRSDMKKLIGACKFVNLIILYNDSRIMSIIRKFKLCSIFGYVFGAMLNYSIDCFEISAPKEQIDLNRIIECIKTFDEETSKGFGESYKPYSNDSSRLLKITAMLLE